MQAFTSQFHIIILSWNILYLVTCVQVMPFSTACSTPLSNFESGQNYKDVQDPAGESYMDFCGHCRSAFLFTYGLWINILSFFHMSVPCSHCQFPAGGWAQCEGDCLDNHSLDTAQQPDPLCAPQPHVCQGERLVALSNNKFSCPGICVMWLCENVG